MKVGFALFIIYENHDFITTTLFSHKGERRKQTHYFTTLKHLDTRTVR